MTFMNLIGDRDDMTKLTGVGAGALMVTAFGLAFLVTLAYIAQIIL